jgi:cysteine desulfurase
MVDALRAGGNPSSIHRAGRIARSRVDAARRQVASLLDVLPAEVVFTSGGTEANSLVLRGSGHSRIFASAVEHDSVLKSAPHAEQIPVDSQGVVDLAALEGMLAGSEERALVSVMFANNETGVLHPIADVVKLARAAGALVHCDAVQGAGKLPVEMHALGVDYISLSAHKMGGPQGVGALIVRDGAPLDSDRLGGAQETNRRAGTENVAGIVGFGVAAVESKNGLPTDDLRRELERALKAIAPKAQVFGEGARRLPNTICISMPGVKAETQVMALDLAGVAVSSGAACSSGKVTRSRVLEAMGVAVEEADTALRISLGWSTTREDIDRLIAAWRDLYIRVRHSDIGRSPMVQSRAA